MKTLFVTHHYLDGFGGGCFASRGFISAFADLSDEMTLLYPIRDKADDPGLPANIRLVPVPDNASRFRKLLRLLGGRLHRFGGIFPKVLAEGKFDTVVFDSCYPSFGLMGLAHRSGCRIVTIHHNFQYEYVRDNSRYPLRPVMLYWTQRCEKEALRGSDLNLTLTLADKNLLTGTYAGGSSPRVEVAGVFEQPGVPAIVESKPVTEDVFVMTGDLGIRQTRVSLEEWFSLYYPTLRQVFPEGTLILAGKNPGPDIYALCEEYGVKLVDTPPSMEPVLRQGKYYVCPVSKGGGIKLRIMDGLRYGMPVIAHAISARGYEPFVGDVLFAYTDRASFRKALEDLKRMDVAAGTVRERYRSYFSYPSGLDRLKRLLS